MTKHNIGDDYKEVRIKFKNPANFVIILPHTPYIQFGISVVDFNLKNTKLFNNKVNF